MARWTVPVRGHTRDGGTECAANGILNLLHRPVDGTTQPDTIEAPQALRLTQQPLANVERYYALRTDGSCDLLAECNSNGLHRVGMPASI